MTKRISRTASKQAASNGAGSSAKNGSVPVHFFNQDPKRPGGPERPLSSIAEKDWLLVLATVGVRHIREQFGDLDLLDFSDNKRRDVVLMGKHYHISPLHVAAAVCNRLHRESSISGVTNEEVRNYLVYLDSGLNRTEAAERLKRDRMAP